MLWNLKGVALYFSFRNGVLYMIVRSNRVRVNVVSMELKCFEYVDIKRLSPVKCIVKLYLRVEIKTEQSYECWFILHVQLVLLILVAKGLNLERKIVKIT